MNSTTDLRDDSRKDPATLEREINQTRAQMDQTLGALEQRFSPGQLLDQALGLVKEHGGDFASNLNNSIKQNPVPVVLTAVGIAWMMMSSNRPPESATYVDDTDYEPLDTRYEYEPMENFEGDDSEHTGGVREKMSEAGERLKAGTEATRRKLASSTDATRRKLARSKDAMASGISRTAETAQAQAQRARHGFNQLLEEQPLILGALGIALGAAIGAALPTTEQENRLLGPARDQAMSTLKQKGAESYERVKDTVEQVAEDAKEKLSDVSHQSSSGDDARDRQRPHSTVNQLG
jgi:hypothetical protein